MGTEKLVFQDVDYSHRLPEAVLDDIKEINDVTRLSQMKRVGQNSYKMNGVLYEIPHIFNNIVTNHATSTTPPNLELQVPQVFNGKEIYQKNDIQYENVVIIPDMYNVDYGERTNSVKRFISDKGVKVDHVSTSKINKELANTKKESHENPRFKQKNRLPKFDEV